MTGRSLLFAQDLWLGRALCSIRLKSLCADPAKALTTASAVPYAISVYARATCSIRALIGSGLRQAN